MKRLFRLALLAFGALWLVALVGALIRKSQALPPGEPDEDDVTLSAVLAPLAFRSTAGAFRHATIDCWFGGGIVDLRGATIDPAGASIEAKAVFGGAQILVPADWHVEVRSRGLGGVGQAARDDDGPELAAPTLTIDALSLFGGFGISTELSPDAERWLGENLVRTGSADPA